MGIATFSQGPSALTGFRKQSQTYQQSDRCKDMAKALQRPHGPPWATWLSRTSDSCRMAHTHFTGRSSLIWSFNTAHRADSPTDWPRLLFFPKLWMFCIGGLPLPGEFFPSGHTHNQRQFMKLEETFTHHPQLFSSLLKLLAQNSSFFGCSARLMHPYMSVRLRGSTEDPFLLTRTNYTSLQLLPISLKRWSHSARRKQGPTSGCCRFQLNKVTFSPKHVPRQFKFHFATSSVPCYLYKYSISDVDIDLTLFSFTERSLLPVY